MKAAETRVDRFLASSETAFAIPVYQRNYDWTRVQCQQLFNDILAIGADESQSGHFIGSIVYVHDDVYTASSLRELTIIDGQQRLTTLTLGHLDFCGFSAPDLGASGLRLAGDHWPAAFGRVRCPLCGLLGTIRACSRANPQVRRASVTPGMG